MKDNVVYVKTENGIFKCYESETMHKPIYYPINSNGYIDYTEVIKVLTIDDLFIENQTLQKQLEEQDYTVIPNSEIKPILDKYKNQQKEFIEWLEKMIKDLSKNEEYETATTYEYILSKYKEIIGGDNK